MSGLPTVWFARYMSGVTGDELKAAAIRLYGKRGWQLGLATALTVDVSSVRRWASGQIPVPGPVAVAVRSLEQL